eukprot:8700995-Pyramimonas_sp.AAC.1
MSHGIRGFSNEELENLTEFFTVIRATPGKVIFTEEEEADFFVVILHGRGTFTQKSFHKGVLPLDTALTDNTANYTA